MNDFFETVFIASIPVLVIIAAVYLPEIKNRKEGIKRQREKLAEYIARTKEAEAAIAILEKEVADKNKLIDELIQENAALCVEIKRKDEVIQRVADRLHQSVLKAKERQNQLRQSSAD